MNHKRIYRLYVEEKLSLGRKRGGSVAGCASPCPRQWQLTMCGR